MRAAMRWALIILVGAPLLGAVFVAGWYWIKKSATHPESSISMEEGERLFRTAVFDNHAAEGIPYWIFKILPEMFPTLFAPNYENVGFVWEPAGDLPLGFNRSSRFSIDWVTHNCALCHAGAYRSSADAEPTIVLGMPNATFRRQIYVEALDEAFTSLRFTPKTILTAIAEHEVLSDAQKAAYRDWVGRLRERTEEFRRNVNTTRDWHPRHPSGAAEGFSAAKRYAGVFDKTIGTADFPSTWEQGKRVIGHWDGISTSTLERVIGSALAIGADGSTINMQQMLDLDHYTKNLSPPPYPFDVEPGLAQRGKEIFTAECADCHARTGSWINTIIPLAEIGADPHRKESLYFSFLWRIKLGTLPGPYPFQHWQTSDGYRSDFLEGVWLRGPYLHNGSVPTIRDLLRPAKDRPKTFWRGTNVLDLENVGFLSENRRRVTTSCTTQACRATPIRDTNMASIYPIGIRIS